MQNSSQNVKNKYYLMLCELHHPQIHGKDNDSNPHIETHYLVYDRYDTKTGISFMDLDEISGYNTDNEYDSDEESNNNEILKIHDNIQIIKEYYDLNIHTFTSHPTIRNYKNIISRTNYIKPEIGEYIILPTQEAIAILKTFWLRIIQKKWKKVFQERKKVFKQRCNLYNLQIREKQGRWPDSCLILPGLKGMLSQLNNH